MELAGPLRTPLGLAQWKRASSPGKAGTSGFLSVSDSNRRVPEELGQESQESSCLRKGTPLASRGDQGVSGPLLSCVWNLRVFLEMHDGDSAPSCCAFTHWVAFEEVPHSMRHCYHVTCSGGWEGRSYPGLSGHFKKLVPRVSVLEQGLANYSP